MNRKKHRCHPPVTKCYYKKITKTCVTKIKYVPTKVKKHCHVTIKYGVIKKRNHH